MNKAIAWFAENHVAANLLMGFLLLAGVVTAFTMKVEVFPEFSLDSIVVEVEYRNASPSEVEESMIRRIEEKVAGLAGVRRIDSTSREGVGTVTIEVMSGWDLQNLLDQVKAEVDRITTFPDEAEKPIVREVTRRTQVLMLALYGDIGEASLKNLAQKVRDDLTSIDGITLVEMWGTRDNEIHIDISEETLRRHGLTLGKVAQAVAKASLDLPAGSIKTSGGEILVRAKGKRYRAKDYADVAVITSTDGSKLTLGQIAELSDGFRDVDLFARFQDKPAAILNVYRVADQNALEVAAKVKKYMEDIRPGLPAGVGIDYFGDRSIILKSRINLLLRNMALGLVLVALLLWMFLNGRLAFWVTLGIPISFLAALWTLPFFDISINMVSLFAFIMVLGIVVDDAIVVGENVYQMREKGYPRLKGAVEGTLLIGRPVIFSVLTTVAAFWPLLLAGGMMGKIMRNIPVVVIVVLMASLLECLFILPSHLSRSRMKTDPEKEKITARWLRSFVRGPYQRMLDWCLKWRYLVLAIGLAMLLSTLGLVTGGHIKFILFPQVESDMLIANLTLPAGTSTETTIEQVSRMDQAARQALAEADSERPKGSTPLFDKSLAIIGLQIGGHGPQPGSADSGGHRGQVYVQMLEGEQRNYSARKLASKWREAVGQVPDAEELTFTGELFSAGKAVEVHLAAPDENVLRAAADDLKQTLAGFAGVVDIGDSFSPGKEEVQLALKPAARTLGLTLEDLASQVRHAFYGAEALRLVRDEDEVRVLVRYPDNERRSLGEMEDMRIRTPEGHEVPFSRVAQVTMERGYSSIERAQRRRVIKVFADVDPTIANASELRARLEKDVLPQLLTKYTDLNYTIEGEGREEKESLQDVLQGFVLALFLIYALLAVPFRSFSQPFIVMAAVPFGLVGALLGHLIMGLDTSMLSMFGMVGLTGVVVNDSLVLIDASNRLRDEGRSPWEAIREAGPMRFRPILLTSLTTFAGLTPMIFERSLQAQFLIPMAVSLGFGVLFATGITLLLIPCGYLILEDVHTMLGRVGAWFRKPREAA